ncbi:MAG: hypothetical protein ABIR98_11460 [Usitatibacter sp.]
MNDLLERLAAEKLALLERCAVQRMQLRRDHRRVRDSLPWRRPVSATVPRPVMQRIVLGFALALLGTGRMGRLAALAGRALLLARAARAVSSLVAPSRPAR